MKKHYPIEPPTPIEAIKFRMEQQGLTVKDLEPAIGKSNRVYEILNGTRNLTLPMIRRLHAQFGIPGESDRRVMARASGSPMHPPPYRLINHRQHAEQQHPLLRFQPQITAQRRHLQTTSLAARFNAAAPAATIKGQRKAAVISLKVCWRLGKPLR